jgi:hypothetical protein
MCAYGEQNDDAKKIFRPKKMVERAGIKPATSAMRMPRSIS